MLLALLRGGARPNTPPLPPSPVPAPARVSAPAPRQSPRARTRVANDGSQLPGRTFWAQFLTPPPSQVLRALRPLIEKVGLESDLETLCERDGEAGVVRASLVRYPYEARPPRPPQRRAAS